MKWCERKEILREEGLTSDTLVETVRKATAKNRHFSRLCEVASALRIDIDDFVQYQKTGKESDRMKATENMGGFLATLDCLGKEGRFGAGGPSGSSARIPQLEKIPRHHQKTGSVWDGAVRDISWNDLNAYTKRGEVFFSSFDGGSTITVGRDNPSDWLPLTEWLVRLAKRIVCEKFSGHRPGSFGSAVYDRGICVHADSSVAEMLIEICEHLEADFTFGRYESALNELNQEREQIRFIHEMERPDYIVQEMRKLHWRFPHLHNRFDLAEAAGQWLNARFNYREKTEVFEPRSESGW